MSQLSSNTRATARMLHMAAVTAIVVVVLGSVWARVVAQADFWTVTNLDMRLYDGRAAPPNMPMASVSFWLFLLADLAAGLSCLWFMARIFRCIALDQALTVPTASAIRSLGWSVVAFAFLKLTDDLFASIIWYVALGPDPYTARSGINVTVSLDDSLLLLAGGVIALVGTAFRQAVAAFEENQSFV